MMECCCCLVTLGLLIVIVYIIKNIYARLVTIPEVPRVDENQWWGPKEDKNNDTTIKPFTINVTEKELDYLKQRLSSARTFTPPLEGIQHQYGINTNLLNEIKDFWQNKYDWRKREIFLNQFPQFTTKIQGLDIHFLHVRPTESNGLKVLPLLLIHGWPGSVREFYEAIPKLIKPSQGRNFVFEVVVPHIPGYGFSAAAVQPGMNSTVVASIFKNLMERLQFEKWYVQGGDWGSEIATHMAILYPEKVQGLHVNMAGSLTTMSTIKRVLGSFCPSLIVSEKHRSKMYPMKNVFIGLLRETGYFHIQATRPDTVGVGLNDSPIGLAAYILEKFIVWTNPTYIDREDGGLSTKFKYEDLLDNIMIYWITNSITTSFRLYAETSAQNNKFKKIGKLPVKVPSAYAQFADDLLYVPETLLKHKFENLLDYSEVSTGGHFAAFEEPELFTDVVWNAIEKFEKYHNK